MRGSLDNATGKRERSNNCGPRWIGQNVPPPGFLYSPFTAADEKIPLSIGQVNSKPQYLVFSSHLQHPPAKPGQPACGKPEMPCRTRLLRQKTASNPVQTRVPAAGPLHFPSLCRTALANKVQNLCRIKNESVRTVDNWTVLCKTLPPPEPPAAASLIPCPIPTQPSPIGSLPRFPAPPRSKDTQSRSTLSTLLDIQQTFGKRSAPTTKSGDGSAMVPTPTKPASARRSKQSKLTRHRSSSPSFLPRPAGLPDTPA